MLSYRRNCRGGRGKVHHLGQSIDHHENRITICDGVRQRRNEIHCTCCHGSVGTGGVATTLQAYCWALCRADKWCLHTPLDILNHARPPVHALYHLDGLGLIEMTAVVSVVKLIQDVVVEQLIIRDDDLTSSPPHTIHQLEHAGMLGLSKLRVLVGPTVNTADETTVLRGRCHRLSQRRRSKRESGAC